VGLKAGQKIKLSRCFGSCFCRRRTVPPRRSPSTSRAARRSSRHDERQGRELGLHNTKAADHTAEPQWVLERRDLSVIARNLIKDPVLKGIIMEHKVRVPRPAAGRASSSRPTSSSHVLGLEGGKTGYTDPAKYCFVAAAKRGKTELVGVVLVRSAPSTDSVRCASCSTGLRAHHDKDAHLR